MSKLFSKKITKLLFVMLIVVIGGTIWHIATASAAFNSSNLMDDVVFNNSSSMSGPGIDSWLNTNFPQSCISTNNGFSSPQPTGYTPSSGFTYGSNVSAGTVIYDAAHVYGLNPEVILATLEKESSVVSGSASYGCQYINTSMGYGCLDNSACPVDPATESGFSKQVIHATWLLRYAEQRSEGNVSWDVQVTNFPNSGDVWDNSDDPQSCYSGPMTQGTFSVCPNSSPSYYDGLDTIDSQSVYIGSGATAALYDYTPHFSGNENFDNIFLSWFGAIYGNPFETVQYSQSAYPTLNPGQSVTVDIEFQNEGTYPWYDDSSFSSAPANEYPVHLATSSPLNSSDPFSSGWPTSTRPSLNFAAVYNSDGTLAGSQSIVEPGQIGKFTFTITAPANLAPGNYTEFFQPVAEGSGNGEFNNPSTFFVITVNPVPALTLSSQSTSSPTVYSGNRTMVDVKLQNTGNVALYDSNSVGSAPSGTYPVHLATDSPLNSSDPFSSGWPTSTRPSLNFAAVYNSDGTTLASNQNVAQPGQIIEFSFPLTAPSDYATGTYPESFTPIMEGTGNGYFPDENITFNINVPSSPVVAYTSSPGTITASANNQQNVAINITNVGNATLPSTTSLYTSSGSIFADNSTWASSSVILNSIGSSINPGQSATLSFDALSPTVSSSTNETLNLQFQQPLGTPVPSNGSLDIPFNITTPTYQSSNQGQSGYPTLSYGENSVVYFKYQNTGNQIWYDHNSISSATTRNPYVIDFATSYPLNRSSGFDDGWFSSSRPNLNFTAVYNSDGSTLASNQNVVEPGQIVEFQFNITPSGSLSPGAYREFFQPVAEGTADGAFNFPWTFIDVTVPSPSYNATQVTQSAYPTLNDGQQAQAYFEYKNTGNLPWYDDTSFSSDHPSGVYPVHLATSMPLNSSSPFGATWPTPSRATLNLSAVFESDGTTLSADQHIVQPGEIGKYTYTLSVPNNMVAGSYRQFFQPVAEGTGNGAFNFPWTSTVVTVQ